jgi:hypothetical protein
MNDPGKVTKRIWRNNFTRIFLIPFSGETQYLSAVAIREIDVKNGTITLWGRLPVAHQLLDIKSGSTVEIVYEACADPRIYRPEGVILRCSHCRIRSSVIPDPVVMTWDETATVNAEVVLDCDIEIVDDESYITNSMVEEEDG